MTDRVAEQRIVPAQEPVDRLGIRINQQLGGIEAMPIVWIVGTVDPISVSQARLHALHVDMPDAVRLFGDCYPMSFEILIAVIEQTELDAGSIFAEQRKVHSRSVPVCTLRIRIAGHRSDCAVHSTRSRPGLRN